MAEFLTMIKIDSETTNNITKIVLCKALVLSLS